MYLTNGIFFLQLSEWNITVRKNRVMKLNRHKADIFTLNLIENIAETVNSSY